MKPVLIESTVCPKCSYDKNSMLEKYCSRCGSILDISMILKHEEKVKRLESINYSEYLRKLEEKLNSLKWNYNDKIIVENKTIDGKKGVFLSNEELTQY